MSRFHFYRPQRSCGQGYVFTRVCDSVHRGGLRAGPPGTRQTTHPAPRDQADTPPAGRTPPGPGRQLPPGRENPPTRPSRPPPRDQVDPRGTRQTPPRPSRPPWQGEPPPRTRQTPTPDQADPPREEDCSIRSMSGRYASYWNAFL